MHSTLQVSASTARPFRRALPQARIYVYDNNAKDRTSAVARAAGASMMLLAFLALTCGFILDTVTHGRPEIKRLAYLTIPSVGALAEQTR